MLNRLTLPGFLKKSNEAMAPLSDEHRERRELFHLYRSYYRGRHRQQLKTRPGSANDNVTLNWSKKVVNHGVNFLFGQPITFEIEGDEEQRSESEQYLDYVFQDDPLNDFSMALLLQTLGQNGGVCGTAFLRLYPDENKPRIVALDPSIMDIVTDPDDMTRVNEYHAVWQAGKGNDARWKRHRVMRGDGDWWEIVEEEYQRTKWVALDSPLRWDYSFAPIFHTQNLIAASEVWGISDLEDADLNDAINFGASNIGRIIRFHAHPTTILEGYNGTLESLDTGVGKLWKLPSGTAKNLEMQSDLSAARTNRADLEEAFHQVADVPRLDPAQVNLGALSGFALRILYGPLLAKTSVKRELYGSMLAKLCHALLAIENREVAATVKVLWKSPLPEDPKEKADIFATLAPHAGSIDAAARQAGYSNQQAADLAANDFSGDLRQ